MSLLHLVRHPPVAVAAGICYGRSDVALADPAMPQADALRARLPRGSRIVSSPLQRCRLFAQRLAGTDPVLVDARLQEIDFGDWELQPFDAIDRRLIDAWAEQPWDFVPPGGESAAAMSLRVQQALRQHLDAAAESLVIVSHGGPLRVMLGILEQTPRADWMAQACSYSSLTRLHLHAGLAVVDVRNQVPPYHA